MNFGKALGIGTVISVVVLVAIFVATFVTGGDVSVPVVLEVSSGRNQAGGPETSMYFNPLGPIVLALVLGTLLWLGSKAASRHQEDKALP
ncbi:hypothetical protein [Arthrobacter sp. CAN_A1]|uniref:hypothetical protein n=1 Tax=Arthrobacter sp. CAN_A1 TaxID=2787717 RepID=UPI0018CBB378